MLAVTDPRVRKITVMGPTQLLKTELINNIVGYFMHQDPAPVIVMQPTGKMAEAWSKDRLDKMLRDTPALKSLVGERRSKEGDNTILHKSFPGGHITVVGSNSPSDLAMRPVRITLRDEVDKYPRSAGNEGDPSKLIQERSATFWNALDVGVCSPTVQGDSAIEAEYELSDKRAFHGKCPFCKELEELRWEQVRWSEENPEQSAHYVCSKCDRPWVETDRLNAISKGEYVATAPFAGHAGFKVNKIASPWEGLNVLVKKWLESQNSPEKLKTFVNTQLAETWQERGEVPEFKRLYERRESWKLNQLQSGIVFLTAGADVQKDRIEVEIVGWGRDKQSWSVDYRVIMGDTATEPPWLELDKIQNETWRTDSNQDLQLRMLAVDSGYNTTHVYNWVKKKSADRVRAIKGSDHLQMTFGQPKDVDIARDGSKLKRACKVWPVGVSVIKSEFYSWLKLDGAGDDGKYLPGFCHYPQFEEEFFKRVCSEQLVEKKVNGRTVNRWVKIHERNEPLDCRIYARAAAAMFGIDRFSEVDWDKLEGKYDLPGTPNPLQTNVTPSSAPPSKPKQESSNGFMSRNQSKKFW